MTGVHQLADDVRGLPFVDGLRRHGDRPALVAADVELSYAELALRVERLAARLTGPRTVVAVCGGNDVGSIVGYRAALRAGHVVLLLPTGGGAEAVAASYGSTIELTGGEVVVRSQQPPPDLHDELALLLSTSGSTGSPKLVRLSYENLAANTAAIVASLGVRPDDRAVTTLPVHYCYGLSVLHSHLAVGAVVVVTDLSVVDPCFWDLFRRAGATTFAGVPYTFELLDRLDGSWMATPSLRYVTQAGGRLEPARVRALADEGRRRGWDLVVMYGQTEATARMAYLPPSEAARAPEAIGVPVPGGTFTIEPVDEGPVDERPVDGGAGAGPACGELVYRGPNVMLGYAEHVEDLALGRTVDELRTGDLARLRPDGLYELVGRRSRFLKLFGLRVDLARVEDLLRSEGFDVHCTGGDRRLVVGVRGRRGADARAALRRELDLPTAAVAVVEVERWPRRPNGKVDLAALTAMVPPPAEGQPAVDVRAAFRRIFPGEAVGPRDSFVSLGGDSLTYVELSIHLEAVLGALPADWHLRSVSELETSAGVGPARLPRLRRVEAGIALRAVAVVLVVATHAGAVDVRGGAHVLLAVAGLNLARFRLGKGAVTRGLLRGASRIAAPTMAWIGALLVLTDDLRPTNLLLVNSYFAPARWSQQWRYWYVEALVQLVAVLALAFAVPGLRRFERRRPFLAAGSATAGALALRVALFDVGGIDHRGHRPATVAWLLAIGWWAARADTPRRRLVVSLVAVAAVQGGFYAEPVRAAVVLVGVLVLVWVRTVPVPQLLVPAVGAVAAASLHVYLTHWQVYPALLDRGVAAWPAVAASLAVGVGAHRLQHVAPGRRVRSARCGLPRLRRGPRAPVAAVSP